MIVVEQEPILHIRHKLSGRPSAAEVGLAMAHTLQHDDLPVLWDLRETEVTEIDWAELSKSISSLVESHRGQMSSMKRAFVVRDDRVAAVLYTFLSELQPPWPWNVCSELDDALRWIQS